MKSLKPHSVSLINAIVLIACSTWGYLAAEAPSMTALIPALFGVLLIGCYSRVKSENKIAAHIAVLLTLIVFLALFMPLRGAISRDDTAAMLRVGSMLVTSAVALIVFIKSFIDVRRARASD